MYSEITRYFVKSYANQEIPAFSMSFLLGQKVNMPCTCRFQIEVGELEPESLSLALILESVNKEPKPKFIFASFTIIVKLSDDKIINLIGNSLLL